MTTAKKTTKTSPSKAPAQKTTEKGVAEKGAEKSTKATHGNAHDGHDHKAHDAKECCKDDDECCGGGCCDDGNDAMDAGEHGCGCGHDHDDEMAVPRTKVKPHKPNTSGIVEDGNIVVLHYTGTLDSGEKFDSSEGKEPIEFAVGSGVVIPGFDTAVTGMRKGEKKKVTIEAKDAYGDPNPAMRQEVPKHALGDITPEVGMLLALHHPMAPQPIPVKVVAVTEETITIDMNHPLAGQRLHFELEIVDIK